MMDMIGYELILIEQGERVAFQSSGTFTSPLGSSRYSAKMNMYLNDLYNNIVSGMEKLRGK